MEKPSSEPKPKRKMQLGEKLHYLSENVRDVAIEVFDDIYTPYRFFIGRVLMWLLSFATSLLASSIKESQNRFFLVRWALKAIKVVVGIPVLIVLSVLAVIVIILGGVVASVVGLRNMADYSFAEQLVAWIPLILICLAFPFFLSELVLFRLSTALVLMLVVLGLNFVYGECGILTLGHAAFVLLGGYGTVWLANGSFGMQFPFVLAVPIASVAVTVIGLILAVPSLRIKDHYLVVVTIAFSIIIAKLLKSRYLSELSGFRDGGINLRTLVPPAWASSLPPTIQNYYLILGLVLILVLVAYNLKRHSQIGRAFAAIKCDVEVAAILGVSTVRYKVLAFSLSAFYAAFGGGLMLLLVPFIGPDSYTVQDSGEYMVGLVVGGVGSVLGALLGGLYLAFEQSIATVLSTMVPRGEHLKGIIHGVILIFMVYFVPKGLASVLGGMFSPNAIIRRWQYFLNPPPDYNILDRSTSSVAEKLAGKGKND